MLALNFLMPWGSFVCYLSPRANVGPPGSPLGGDPRVDPMLQRLCGTADEGFCRARLKLVRPQAACCPRQSCMCVVSLLGATTGGVAMVRWGLCCCCGCCCCCCCRVRLPPP